MPVSLQSDLSMTMRHSSEMCQQLQGADLAYLCATCMVIHVVQLQLCTFVSWLRRVACLFPCFSGQHARPCAGVDTAAGMCLPGVGELAQLLMADLTIKHPEIAAPCPGLRQAAADLLAANGSGDLHAGGLPQREHVDWAGAAVGLTGADPLQSAREASLGSQVGLFA